MVAAGAAVIALLAFVMLRGSGPPALAGTELDGVPAPDFTLTDYRGETVTLSDFRGKVVILTFIYTNCPDVCPTIAHNLQTAYEQLPAERQDDVAMIAVTIDPEQDTPQALREFSERHGLGENASWYALRGDPATLERVWQAYGIYPGMRLATPAQEHRKHVEGTPTAGGGMGHTDAIFVIDPDGRQRVLMRSYLDPAAVAHNIEALAD
jgi:protein SCO1/2